MKTSVSIPITPNTLSQTAAEKKSDISCATILSGADELQALSRQQIKQAIQKGALWLERNDKVKRQRRIKTTLKTGDKLHFYYDEAILSQQAKPARLISNEGNYSIWFKPAGMLVQGSKWGDHCSITRVAEHQLQRPCFLVHRLDKATSGLMILAHTKKIAAKFSSMFAHREIEKTYRARVSGPFLKDNLPLKINNSLGGKTAISIINRVVSNRILDSKSASYTEWKAETCSTQSDSSQHHSNNLAQAVETELEINIETGRKHQIRQHLAQLGYPVIGDRLYGNATATSPDLQLTAWRLAFICPIDHTPKKWSLDHE